MEDWLGSLLEDAQLASKSAPSPQSSERQKTTTLRVREAASAPLNLRQDEGVAVGRPPGNDVPGLTKMLAHPRHYSNFALSCLFFPKNPPKGSPKQIEKGKKPGQRRK
ncbi:MAG: hypothetical protein A2X77_06160 [Gammaproteobacteria bacterium GWE2_42_36]|nr:MAG: hypothetical protein A2X77_06160 [Gammaproteobacteria bacterium GWE2_42_36]HCU05022.1 hypothetical protein [Coxiellaceae bacterium]